MTALTRAALIDAAAREMAQRPSHATRLQAERALAAVLPLIADAIDGHQIRNPRLAEHRWFNDAKRGAAEFIRSLMGDDDE